jgi:integrase
MAKHRRLTNAMIEQTRATKSDAWLTENDGSRGNGRLMVRISKVPTRLFYFKYSVDGRVKRVPMGRYSRVPLEGYVTLEEARSIARHYFATLCAHGKRDPEHAIGLSDSAAPCTGGIDNAHGPSSSTPSPRDTVLDLCNAYADHLQQAKKPFASDVRNIVKNYIAGTEWATIPSISMSQRDVVSLLRAALRKSSKHTSNKVRSVLSAAYGCAIEASSSADVSSELAKFEIQANPVTSTKKLRGACQVLERALTPHELGLLWHELTHGPDADTAKVKAVRLSLLLGGQRCKQLLRVRLVDVDMEELSVTILDGKGRRATPRKHCLPLLPAALREVRALVEDCDTTQFLFPGRSGKTYLESGCVSRVVREISDRLIRCGDIKKPFGYRDIRRTIETHMSDYVYIPKEIRAQIQSHDLGGVQIKDYNRATFLSAKRDALERWAAYLDECAKAAEAKRAAEDQPKSC